MTELAAGPTVSRPPPRKRRRVAVRSLLLQALAVGLVVAAVAWLGHNTVANLERRGIAGGFDFLARSARFPISESLLAYRPSDSFARAFLVGLSNTLFISAVVAVLATGLGFGVGLARRATHPLAFGLASAFVELMRNTPVVVQLLFWYALITVGLPNVHAALNPLPGVHLADRGLFLPVAFVEGPPMAAAAAAALLAGALVSATILARRVRVAAGRPRAAPFGLAMALALGAIVVAVAAGLRIGVDAPRLGRFNFAGGFELSPELTAILVGLTLYSAAFIAEIIRGGIDAVAKGQWEAGRALGLSEGRTLRLIVLPQALRIIVPPLTSQYINIVKNTTLALVVGYPDIAFVTATTINQTGQAVEGIFILMAVFLAISLLASLLMNHLNARLALVQR
jgi:general L-amino acid transport system permease protein